MRKTSIIIPYYNGFEYTKMCVESIVRNASNYEIILVDNGSTEIRTKADFCLNSNTCIVRNSNNRGFPAAVNFGVSLAMGDYICILNNDVITTPSWLDNMLYYIEKDLLDVVGPVTNSISGPQQVWSKYYDGIEELDAFAKENAMTHASNFKRLHRLVGFCLLMKKEVWQKCGPFDEIYSPGNFEDDDFCMKAIEEGYRLGYALDAFIHHFGTVTHKLLNLEYMELLEKNQKIFIDRWGEKLNQLVKRNEGYHV